MIVNVHNKSPGHQRIESEVMDMAMRTKELGDLKLNISISSA